VFCNVPRQARRQPPGRVTRPLSGAAVSAPEGRNSLTAAVASSVGFSFALDGLIDEVRISSQALPESELLINLAQPIRALSIPTLRAWVWRCY